jgi:hypothetical protein
MIYKFKGSESYKDLCDLEDKGIISRSDHNVYKMTMIILDTIVRFIPVALIAWIVLRKGD